MSRTSKGGKGPGFEYWTARQGNRCGGFPLGKFFKKRTHSRERHQASAEIAEQLHPKAQEPAANMKD